MSMVKNAFKGFDPNNLDFATSGNWPVGVKVICYLLVIAALVAAGWHFYAVDKQKNLRKEISKEQQLKDIYAQKAHQVANLEALQKQMEDVEERFAELKKQLPTQKEVPGLLDDLTLLGTGSGLSIGSISLQSETKQDFYIELPINISVIGSYHQLGQFVSGIAALPRIVTLHNYSITPTGQQVTMNISAKTYRFDDAK
ncbi:type 4a pilus biogenesis protein PilO [Neptuniibacter caesariensis]|uniref:Type 4 fimbrial biogenesis protein PilO n=1 Tax=Neptuniibacter caesariensis TaxID=207954 RepID=A0A7U8C4Q6_NEPCE|nr:type 4a pilus biogenesis protein PilO [Neptuniibacter caesariensis]EAR61418.1 type 4 fimbrial biogenesis protein PilO [Oceanospirillum sp. MED92] [Neptuniibacter caesariensis]